ncbi:BglG family transcription antiterminator [Candidatus Cetobacterium colombiensis]|uniref:Mga helix-turn-helix domain-containing protein n=1 Tax=Candidatus Cetobacterium colombiensis TaxID=3073100 RepID=A0ABU4W8Y4_9FUSO|nr:hypothetical protein [Candidatus Cetobacterium colombiensis]MDX8335968.1 hypothetical protein [Candidatus Cetobacterium colombiensis]
MGVVQINTTNINILTLLSQGEFSLDELSTYLNLEKKSIYKNIHLINIFLQDEKLSQIKLTKNLYSLNLNREQWKKLFSRKDFITSDEIVDYLYIKFIHNGFINLEAEKEILNVSRSSVIRYFNEIKSLLSNNGTQYIYLTGKGLKIVSLGELDKNTFCKKLIKFFVKCDFSLNHSIFITNLIKDYKMKDLLNSLYNIFKNLNIPTTHFIISFLCSLYICNNIFNGFDFKGNYKYENYLEIEQMVKLKLKDYNSNYQQQVFYFIVKLLNKDLNFENDTLDKALKIIEKLKLKLNLENLNESLEYLILKKICFSIFKYENQIFKIRNIKTTNREQKLLIVLDDILKDLNLNLFHCDKIAIIHILKKVVIDYNKHRVKNILLLFNEVVISDDIYLEKNLKVYHDSLSFDIEPTFFYKLNYKNYTKKYDLILTDEPHLNIDAITISSFSYIRILDAINNYVFDISLDKVN